MEQKNKQLNGFADRISVTYGTTIQVRDYEPKHVSVTYSSDLQKGETPEEGYKRVADFVAKEIYKEEKELKELRKQLRKK